MQPTFKCRCGTNLFVFKGEREASCGVCGELNLLPPIYWQEHFVELKTASISGVPLDYSNSDSSEVDDWKFNSYFKKVVHFFKTRRLWSKPKRKTNLFVIVTAIVSPLIVGIVIQNAQNRSVSSEGRLAYQIDIAQPVTSYFQSASVPTDLLVTEAYFAGATSAQTCKAFEKVFELNLDEKTHPNWMSSLNFFDCLNQNDFELLGK